LTVTEPQQEFADDLKNRVVPVRAGVVVEVAAVDEQQRLFADDTADA